MKLSKRWLGATWVNKAQNIDQGSHPALVKIPSRLVQKYLKISALNDNSCLVCLERKIIRVSFIHAKQIYTVDVRENTSLIYCRLGNMFFLSIIE